MELFSYIPPNLFNAISSLIALLIIYKLITHLIKKILVRTPYAEETKSFLNIWKYAFVVIIIIFTIFGSKFFYLKFFIVFKNKIEKKK